MLDTTTKRRIDTARDILVGKIPDPKSQVEQITIALIYKFMEDMDLQSEEFGGAKAFFSGDFERYSWSRLIRSGLGGHEVLNLYAEAIQKMPENPNIPELFRSIFRNAFLPYRDPETLRVFLKIVDEFEYDHSEKLGDAFEYLLSVLGSQGDAGQFRTPRHIIDFIVEIVNPQKNDVILDPACGTAGFLISAYKHILQQNSTNPETAQLPGDQLSHHDRELIAKNIRGYDISPDMVRLSLVNLYLHGFADPKIVEYNTLTSDERWTEYADVILANPPFMSPKGGIRTHNRFSIQSKRSEVLFVDYIMEHLNSHGRAGIIVPEGIIFQSQTAYKTLRKLLVEEALIAVISLPAGVFNPYSGVKTSILVLDKALAEKSSTIGFFKIDHDGFSLGAQRREGGPNDLPSALEEIEIYRTSLMTGQSGEDFVLPHGLVIDKARLVASGDYNLSGERYRVALLGESEFPMVPLGLVCEINPSKREVMSLPSETVVSFLPMADLEEHSICFAPKETTQLGEIGQSYTYFADGDVLLAKVTPCFENGKAGVARGLNNAIGFGSSEYFVLRPSEQIVAEYLYRVLMADNFRLSAISQMTGTGGLQRIPRSFLMQYAIPLPPPNVQHEIIEEIEGYQKVIDGARAVIENYRAHIAIDPSWPVVELGDHLSAVVSGLTPRGGKEVYLEDGVLFIRSQNVLSGSCDFSDAVFIDAETHNTMARSKVIFGDVFLNITGASIGRSAIMPVDREANVNQHVAILRPTDQLSNLFLSTFLNSAPGQLQIRAMQSGASREALNYAQIRQFAIPLPPIEEQMKLVSEIDAERQMVNSNRKLVERMQRKIDAAIARVWCGNSDTA